MRIINTKDLDPTSLNAADALYIYNGLDCMVTEEVLQALLPQLTPVTAATYRFSRQLQGPILDMNMRGVLIDEDRRQSTIRGYREDINRLSDQLNRLIREGIGFEFEIGRTRKNPWPSDAQLKELFYRKMGMTPIRKRNSNGEMVETVDREALEKLEHYFYAEPIVRHLLTLRDLGKRVSFLSTAVDSDGRLRTSFNIAGTTTGRLASSYSDFGTGTNLQNVENRLRAVFVADPGWKFCNIDLEQGDSRGVGAILWNLFRDSSYLDACESGDLHTTVCRNAFSEIGWTGDMALDKQLAGTKFYRDFSYRDAGKRLGHGTNYQGEPPKMSRATHIPQHQIEVFQARYLKQFPAFRLWWQWVEEQVRDKHTITTLLGRKRTFFGHHKDSETIRQAIAYEPQSVTADTIDSGLLDLWYANRVQLLLQVHDSVLFQYRECDEDRVVPWAIDTIQRTVRLKGGRDFMIPAEAKVGWNWSDLKDDPDALRKWNGGDDRKRERVI